MQFIIYKRYRIYEYLIIEFNEIIKKINFWNSFILQ